MNPGSLHYLIRNYYFVGLIPNLSFLCLGDFIIIIIFVINRVTEYAPLKTKTITLRPTALWYTEEIRSEKRKRRALERRWRSSKRESDYFRCLRVNALIKKTKVEYYSGIIRESSNNP